MKKNKLSEGERLTITLTKEEKNIIKKLANDEGLTMCGFVRQIIKKCLRMENE